MPAAESESPVALAVDIGGTKVDAALVDTEGRIVPGSRHRAPTGAEQTPETFAGAIASVCARATDAAGPAHRLVGVGV
ncbi:ROK family protein, partial [Agromyces binzhouensis]